MQLHCERLKNQQMQQANETNGSENHTVQHPTPKPSLPALTFSSKWPYLKFKKRAVLKPQDSNEVEMRRQLKRFTVSIVAQERNIQQLHTRNVDLTHIVETQQRRLQRLNFQLAMNQQMKKKQERCGSIYDEVPDLPSVFPIGEDEEIRLREVLNLGLMTRCLPDIVAEDAIDSHLMRISNEFPHVDSIFFTAVGSSTYRVLAARIHEKDGAFVSTRHGGIQHTRYAQFGHRNLSACQYTTHEAATLCFSDVRVPPMISMLKRFPNLFDTLARYDPTLKYYIQQSMNRKAWKTIMNILTEETHLIPDVTPELSTMFELFAYFQNNYIGAPVTSNGHVVGVICFLHNHSSDDEENWKKWSKIEELAEDLSTIIGLQSKLIE